MIFQDPMTSLNPVYKVGWQIAEQIRAHEQRVEGEAHAPGPSSCSRRSASRNAEQRVDDYPHQFSGGMRQRVMIAMALSCNPDLLIADEPTTALDVTIQAQILELIRRLKDDFGSAVVLITHDMGVVADIADRVMVMYAGRVVERGARRDLFYDAQHPYTWGLLGLDPAARPAQARAADGDPGHAAVAAQPAAGVQLRPALPAALRALRRGAPARGPAAATATSTPASSTPRRSAAAARRRSIPSCQTESA